MRKKIIFSTVIFFYVCFVFSFQKVFAADNDCSPGFTDSTRLQQSYTDPFPLAGDTLLKQSSGATEFRYFILKVKVNHPDFDYTLNPDDLAKYELDSGDAYPSTQNPSINNTDIVTFKIFVNESSAQPINPIFKKASFNLPLKVQTNTGNSIYCQVPISTVIVTPVEFSTLPPEAPICTVEIIPKSQIIKALSDVTIGVFCNDRNYLLNIQRLYRNFTPTLFIDKEYNRKKEKGNPIFLSREEQDIQVEYMDPAIVMMPNIPSGRYYIATNIGGFTDGYKVTVTFSPDGHDTDGSVSFEVGKIPSTSTPVQTPEEEATARNLKNLEKICEENIVRPTPADGKDYSDLVTKMNKEVEDCKKCVTGTGDEGPGAWTAIGCLPTNIPAFFGKYVFTIGLGLAGGIGFLLIVWGAFTILISGGNPEQINKGREIIISAIAGLLLIIFSVLILKIIGVDIIQIPGFG